MTNKPLEEILEMSVRLTNALKNANIRTVEQFLAYDLELVLRLPNCGRKTYKEAQELKENILFRKNKEDKSIIEANLPHLCLIILEDFIAYQRAKMKDAKDKAI